MKKSIFIIICLIVGQLCLAQQVNFDRKGSKLSMDNEIVPYVEEFISEAQERGFYVRFLLMNKIDYIFFHEGLGTSEGDDRIGVVGKDERGIYISPKIKDNPIKMRLTIYHEIGHILKKSGKHTCKYCYEIMSEYSPPDLKPFMNPKFWKLKLDNYFNWLNKG